jgi:hypothetical protein
MLWVGVSESVGVGETGGKRRGMGIANSDSQQAVVCVREGETKRQREANAQWGDGSEERRVGVEDPGGSGVNRQSRAYKMI